MLGMNKNGVPNMVHAREIQTGFPEHKTEMRLDLMLESLWESITELEKKNVLLERMLDTTIMRINELEQGAWR